jgi:hypothetical protein
MARTSQSKLQVKRDWYKFMSFFVFGSALNSLEMAGVLPFKDLSPFYITPTPQTPCHAMICRNTWAKSNEKNTDIG